MDLLDFASDPGGALLRAWSLTIDRGLLHGTSCTEILNLR